MLLKSAVRNTGVIIVYMNLPNFNEESKSDSQVTILDETMIDEWNNGSMTFILGRFAENFISTERREPSQTKVAN